MDYLTYFAGVATGAISLAVLTPLLKAARRTLARAPSRWDGKIKIVEIELHSGEKVFRVHKRTGPANYWVEIHNCQTLPDAESYADRVFMGLPKKARTIT